MFTKSASPLYRLSSKEDSGGFVPRQGQQELVTYLKTHPLATTVAAKLPGGYGKSIAIALAYAEKRGYGQCNRLLIVVANDSQREQIRQDFKNDCKAVGIEISDIWTFDREANTVRAHLEDRAEVFVTTIQQVSSTSKSEIDTLSNLLNSKGKWMLAADEYHHYATEKDWGKALQRIVNVCQFTLALSATPDRDGNPTIFGDPQISVPYRNGIRERVLKRMRVASYHYAVDVITSDGQVFRYTTDELLADAASVKDIDTYEERRQIRYSPKYIHPLILHPATRLQAARAATGKKLQMLIRAMSCRHAQAVAEQIRGLLGDTFNVEWVGTGPNGRPDDENRRICKEFCPPKQLGSIVRPEPKIDVLVQVGIAGEGFDSVFVTEIVDLSLVKMNGTANQTKQFGLRGSRWIPGMNEEYQVCHINVPSDHPLTTLLDESVSSSESDSSKPRSIVDWLDSPGTSIEDLMDGQGDNPQPRLPVDWRDEIRPLDPDALRKLIEQTTRNIELMHVNLDNEHFTSWVDKLNTVSSARGKQPWDMTNSVDLDIAIQAYKSVATVVAKEQDEQMMLHDIRSRLDSAIGTLAFMIVREKQKIDATIERSQPGDVKKLINGKLYTMFGPRNRMLRDELLLVYNKIVEWSQAIRQGDMPSWAV
jgi:superfamily II DNA or RNA helicase